ncbi:hexose transporter 2 [Fusarium phyllophilum]|uniref:Hexose transporter 2 n=1 Tax=Fusarium phyllophilum TaxID=47803 RepID=A0A8H5MWS6_9HYPO|nr:hexose transporter 2 [Fusarium phyllophilum]
MADNIITATKGGRFSEMTRTMVFLLMYMCFCSFDFGYDVGNFGSVQGMQAFGRQFGTCDEETGKCSLQPWLSSVMTSVPFIGKALGTVICGVIAERWGRKIAIMGLIIASFVGVLLQTTATTAPQFTIGSFISFAMTGMTIVVVPIYQAETAPKALRGLITSSLQLMIILGSLVASLVTWLLAKDRVEEATKSLRRIRKDKSEEDIEFEIQAIQHAHSNDHKGKWSELFDVKNRRRTMVAILAMFGQQITGQAFASQYSVIFYLSQGFGARSFVFSVLSSVAGLACLFITWFTVDLVGRRVLLLIGGTGMAVFLFIVGAVGTIKDPTETQKNTLVASFILFSSAYALSWAPVSYIVLSEAASSHVKEKTNLLASVISVLTTFATSFTLPYLLTQDEDFPTVLLALPAVFAAPAAEAVGQVKACACANDAGETRIGGYCPYIAGSNVNVDGQDYCFPATTWSEYMDTRFTAEFCPGYFPGYPNLACKTVTVCPLIGDYQ